ncbi:MAG: RNA-binding protein [Chitinispirillales bacterium]|jgi:RNA recognition motif-containing protein|nr:RNA-binding protein [Chitinispirillales bacterium]
MSQKLYVGNLPYRTTEKDVRKLFEKYEPIHSLITIYDKETEQPRGYCFVELDEPKADDALYDLRNTEFNGRNLRISVATGKGSKKEAEEASKKNASEKMMTEKRKANGHTAAARTVPRRHNCLTTTEYMVTDVNNYG